MARNDKKSNNKRITESSSKRSQYNSREEESGVQISFHVPLSHQFDLTDDYVRLSLISRIQFRRKLDPKHAPLTIIMPNTTQEIALAQNEQKMLFIEHMDMELQISSSNRNYR